MSDDQLLLDRDDKGIVTITLNRPERLNALTKNMWSRLGDIFRELSDDESVRCIMITGAGEKAFSPGNDISEFETDRSNSEKAAAYGAMMAKNIEAMKACPHPTVAAIRGICVGGGMEIAGLCDIRICGEQSRFGAPIAKLGLVMGYHEIGALSALVGKTAALEILLEGRILDAKTALRLGIVTRIVEDASVMSEAREAAERVAAGAPLVHRWHKKFLRRLQDPTPLGDDEIAEGYACYDTDDFKTGYQAFLEKKKPTFSGA